MSLKIRRLLYLLFITAFLIITPLVILYAAGYKLNYKGIKLQKTGSFILDSEPRGAKISLNNKPWQTFFKKYLFQKNNQAKTPIKIKNLLPGEYDIKLELDGYWPWQKKLSINPGTATFIEDIYLFKNNPPLQLTNGPLDNIFLSPIKEQALLFNQDKISVLNLASGQTIKTITATATSSGLVPTATVVWSPDSQKILINRLIFNINDWNNPIFLDQLAGPQAKNFKWSDDGQAIYYHSQNSINYYNLILKTKKTIIENQLFTDYLPKDNYLYLVKNINQTANLDIFTDDGEKLAFSINLPYAAYAFLNPDHELINLYDQEHQMLYLIDIFSLISPLRETLKNVKLAHWINNNKLLYANDFEIWILDMENNKKTLLTRISQEIEEIIWHPSNSYVIFTTDQTINIIELDDRQKRNITELIKLDYIKWPRLNKKGDILYFYAKISSQEGLYKLNIH